MKNTFLLNVIIVLILIGLTGYFFSTMIIHILIALTLATILRVPLKYLNHLTIKGYHMPLIINIGLLLLGLAFFVWNFTLLLAPLIEEEIAFISNIDFKSLVTNIQKPLDYLEAFLKRYLPFQLEPDFLSNYLKKIFEDFSTILDFSLVNSILSFTGSLLTGTLTVTFIAVFLIYEDNLFQKTIMRFIPNRYFELILDALVSIELQLSNYLRGLFIQMLCVFSLCWLSFTILDSQHALLIAIFTALANFIPFLGPLVGSILGILIEFSTRMDLNSYNDYSLFFLKILIVFGTIQLLDNVIFQPLIFSKSNNAHPLQIFLAVITGAILIGVFGMIIAIPSLIVLRVLYNKYLYLRHATIS